MVGLLPLIKNTLLENHICASKAVQIDLATSFLLSSQIDSLIKLYCIELYYINFIIILLLYYIIYIIFLYYNICTKNENHAQRNTEN